MGECGIAPTPDNFELFYLHASGENPAISQIIAKHLAEKKPFPPQLLQELRLRVRADVPAMEQVGDGMNSVIAGVLSRLSDAGRDAGEYSSALSAATGALGSDHSPADMRKLMNTLVAA